MTLLPSLVEAPAWLEGAGPYHTADVVAFRNGLLHLPSLVTGKQHFMSRTPRFFNLNCLDFDFDLNAPEPVAWLRFLDQLWPADRQSIESLQEWLGYLLTSDTAQQRSSWLSDPKEVARGRSHALSAR